MNDLTETPKNPNAPQNQDAGTKQNTPDNPLGYKSIPSLLRSFAIPSIIAMLVSSLYNIVDQIFIGQGVGYLGNAATNVSYPLTTICLAIALLIGIGSASRFSLHLGAGETDIAQRVVGNGICMILARLRIHRKTRKNKNPNSNYEWD